MRLRSAYVLVELASLLFASGCLTRVVYERLAFSTTELQSEPTCEVRRSGELAELVVRARFKDAGQLTLSTGNSAQLFDGSQALSLRPVRTPKLRVPSEPCVLATNPAAPERGYFLRAEQNATYRLYQGGAEQATKAAQVSLPSEVRNRGGLAGFVFAAPFLVVLDLTPIGWVTWLAIQPKVFH